MSVREESMGKCVLIPSELGVATVGVCAVSSFESPAAAAGEAPPPLIVDVEEDRVKGWVKGAR